MVVASIAPRPLMKGEVKGQLDHITPRLPPTKGEARVRRQRIALKTALCCSAIIVAACGVALLSVLELGRVTQTRAHPQIVRATGFQNDASSVKLYASGALSYPATFSSFRIESASCLLAGTELPVMSMALNSTVHSKPGQSSFEGLTRLVIHDFEEIHSLVVAVATRAPPAMTNVSCDAHGTVMLLGIWPVAIAAQASFSILDPAQSIIHLEESASSLSFSFDILQGVAARYSGTFYWPTPTTSAPLNISKEGDWSFQQHGNYVVLQSGQLPFGKELPYRKTPLLGLRAVTDGLSELELMLTLHNGFTGDLASALQTNWPSLRSVQLVNMLSTERQIHFRSSGRRLAALLTVAVANATTFDLFHANNTLTVALSLRCDPVLSGPNCSFWRASDTDATSRSLVAPKRYSPQLQLEIREFAIKDSIVGATLFGSLHSLAVVAGTWSNTTHSLAEVQVALNDKRAFYVQGQRWSSQSAGDTVQAEAEFGQPMLGVGPGSVSLRGTWSPAGSSSRRRLQTAGSGGQAVLNIDSEDILPWLFPLATEWRVDATDAGSSPISLVIDGNANSSVANFTQLISIEEGDQLISATFRMEPHASSSLSPAAFSTSFRWGDGSWRYKGSRWDFGRSFSFGRGFPVLLNIDFSSGDASLVFDGRLDLARAFGDGVVRNAPYPPPAPPLTPGACTNDCIYAFNGRCDDSGSGSLTSLCSLGTDCSDCGVREDVVGSGSGTTPSPPPPQHPALPPTPQLGPLTLTVSMVPTNLGGYWRRADVDVVFNYELTRQLCPYPGNVIQCYTRPSLYPLVENGFVRYGDNSGTLNTSISDGAVTASVAFQSADFKPIDSVSLQVTAGSSGVSWRTPTTYLPFPIDILFTYKSASFALSFSLNGEQDRTYSATGVITPGSYAWLQESTLTLQVGVGSPLPVTVDATLTYNHWSGNSPYSSISGFFTANGTSLAVEFEPNGVSCWPQKTSSSLSVQWGTLESLSKAAGVIPSYYAPWPIAVQSHVVSNGQGLTVTAEVDFSATKPRCGSSNDFYLSSGTYYTICDGSVPQPPIRISGSIVPSGSIGGLRPASLNLHLDEDNVPSNPSRYWDGVFVSQLDLSYGGASIAAIANVTDTGENQTVAIHIVPSAFRLDALCSFAQNCFLGPITVNANVPKTCASRFFNDAGCNGRFLAPGAGVGAAGVALVLGTLSLANVQADGVAITSGTDVRLLFASAGVFMAIVDHVFGASYAIVGHDNSNPSVYWYDLSASVEVESEPQTLRTSTYHDKLGPTHSLAEVSTGSEGTQETAGLRVDSPGAVNALLTVSGYIELVGATLLKGGPFLAAVAQQIKPPPPPPLPPPSPAPPPLPPLPPPFSPDAVLEYKVSGSFIAAGEVSDFDTAQRNNIISVLATEAGVDPSAVSLTVTPASVLISYEITAANSTAADSISASLASGIFASSGGLHAEGVLEGALTAGGVNVAVLEVQPVQVVVVQQSSSGSSSSSGAAFAAAGAGGAILVIAVLYMIRRRAGSKTLKSVPVSPAPTSGTEMTHTTT